MSAALAGRTHHSGGEGSASFAERSVGTELPPADETRFASCSWEPLNCCGLDAGGSALDS